ncbi:entry-triggering protein EtpE [Ehrlichia japonica]|uniref:Glycine-rich domain-containing protein n=1 Tax=Ehrlichia japonica TaxID=391036 RepID=X5H204_9RICK|nr:hypothetical protein [Ehrlichia japonica]AHX04859.1 hypothetical protein EHF_0138 [Ehrlichia japonica]
MKMWRCKGINLYLVILLSFVYTCAPLHAVMSFVSDDVVAYAWQNYNTYYGLHFSDYYKPLNSIENSVDSVMIKFASHNDYRARSFLEYMLGLYQDLENMYAVELGVPFNRQDRTFAQHDVIFMQLSSYWGKVTIHNIPIGGCKPLYAGTAIYGSVAAIAFLENTSISSEVCICLVGDCNVKPIRGECNQTSIRCKKVITASDPPPFCSMLDTSNIVSITPLAFSKQTFFSSGVKIHIYSGSEKLYAKELYAKSYKVGDRTSYNISYAGVPYEFQVYKGSYGKVCVEYINSGVKEKDVCFPSPELMRPKVTPSASGVHIQYQDCQGLSDCNVDMSSGTQNKDMGFSVIKPKINLNNYTLLSQYKCKDGKIVEDVNQCANGVSMRLGYVNDNNGNVTCVINMPFVPMKYSIKKNNRDLWLNIHEKMLSGYGVVDDGKEFERYVNCDHKFAIDIKSMTQDQLDKISSVKQDTFFNIAGHYNAKSAVCRGSMLYKYENYRLYEEGDQISCKDVVELDYGTRKIKVCNSLYVSDDDFTDFFHADGELKDIVPLNPILQGMCVSNFPSYEYKRRTLTRTILPTSYKLSIDKQSTECDFLKIEAWGGGASGISRSGKSGKAGNYVMGLLKFDKNIIDKKLIIEIGTGGKGVNSLSNSGGDTTVKLCDDNKNCLVKLVANGGDEGGNYLRDNSEGVNNLVHYRFAPGLQNSGENEILVPYQSADMPYGKVKKGDKECLCSSNLLEKNSNKYWGAGGCSSVYNCAQEGADGMVKLTCEKWSGPVGKIKLIDENSCDDLLVTLIEKINKSTSAIPNEVKEFLNKISQVDFCIYSKGFPNLMSSMYKYFSTVDEIFVSGNVSGDNLAGLRKELLTELSRAEVKAMLAKLGVHDSPATVLLYIDALDFNFGVNVSSVSSGLLNYYVSEGVFDYNFSENNTSHSKIPDDEAIMFNITSEKPEQSFSLELKDQEFIRQYKNFIDVIHKNVAIKGEGHKRNDIVVSWMYAFFKSDKQLFELYAAPFVKLMLGMDLNKFMKWGNCSDEHIKLFKSISKYGEKLPSKVQDFIGKIATGDFCNTFSEVALLNSYITELSDYVYSCALGNDEEGCLEGQWSTSLGSAAYKLEKAVYRDYQVFTDVGVTSNKKEVFLLLDAAIFNYVMSKLNVGNSDITKTLSLLKSRSPHIFSELPYDTILELRQDVNNVKYGDHRVNIITLWSYATYSIYEWDVENFKSFVSLLLELDMQSIKIRRCTSDVLDLFRRWDLYRDRLPKTLRDFLDKILNRGFCRQVLRFPELKTALIGYTNVLSDALRAGRLFNFGSLYHIDNVDRKQLSNVKEIYSYLVDLWSDVGKLSSSIANLLDNPDIYKIFTDTGITSSKEEISLIIDAIIFNLLVSETQVHRDKMNTLLLLFNDNNRVTSVMSVDNRDEFPGMGIVAFQRNITNKYGDDYAHNTDIIVLWSYISYISSESRWSIQKCKSFIKLLLGMDVDFEALQTCGNDVVDLFKKLNTYNKDKLPLKLQRFLDKINEKSFCKKISQFPELETSLIMYVNALRDILRSDNVLKLGSAPHVYNNIILDEESLKSQMKVYHMLQGFLSNIRKSFFSVVDLLNNPDIYKIFTDMGITDSAEEISLIVDAVIFNLLVSEIKIEKKVEYSADIFQLMKFRFLSLPPGKMPAWWKSNFYSINKLRLIDNSVVSHRVDVFTLWSYISHAFLSIIDFEKNPNAFTEMLFPVYRELYEGWGNCDKDEIAFLESINQYSEKFSSQVQMLIKQKIMEKSCGRSSVVRLLSSYSILLRKYIVQCILNDVDTESCVNGSSLRANISHLQRQVYENNYNYLMFRPFSRRTHKLNTDVVVIHYLLDQFDVNERKKISSILSSWPMFPKDDITRLRQGANGDYKANMVALWFSMVRFFSSIDLLPYFVRLIMEGE